MITMVFLDHKGSLILAFDLSKKAMRLLDAFRHMIERLPIIG